MYDLLKGIRILDLSAVVLGPFATRYLGDFGADVIKVEPPTGDIFRQVEPARSKAMGAGHLAFNRNKRSLCLNLKDAADRQRFMALLKDADALVHNMRPAAARRLGLEPARIRRDYPRLVYCVAPGFASRGRDAERPAYDDIIQAAAGIAHLNRDQDGAPRFLPTVLCDKIGGLHLALAVLAGVVQQLGTGAGCVIEAPMFEGLVSFLMAEHLAGETFRPALGEIGYRRLMTEQRRPFPTKDGYIRVLPYNGKHWADFLKLAGRDDLAAADWVRDAAKRGENIGRLYAIVAALMPERTTAAWLELLRESDIPCAPVNAPEALFDDPQLQDVKLFQDVEHPTEGPLRAIRPAFWVEGAGQCPDRPAPALSPTGAEIAWRPRASKTRR